MYLPSLLFAGAFGICAFAFGHMMVYPEKAIDAMLAILSTIPQYGTYALSRLSAAAFNKVFGTGAQPPVRIELPAPPPTVTDLQHKLMVLGFILALGWAVAGRPPARPPARPPRVW